MKNKKRILICPLDWGLGHATRCIPIIRYLQELNAEVIVAAENRPLALLKKEFPSIEFIQLPGYNITYPARGSMTLKMIKAIPSIIIGIANEHRVLKNIINTKKIDAVISDNRFGLWNKKVPCIFITHQINIKAPFGESILNFINRFFIKKYNQCWVPDIKGHQNLSGELSHTKDVPENTIYIGPISRFNAQKNTSNNFDYDVLVILSGPEPQRSIFEKKILNQLNNNSLKVLIVQGITEKKEECAFSKSVKMISTLNSNELESAILKSKVILSRSGYSSIMDLAKLGRKAIFVPTPGQTEQGYLAQYLMNKGIAYTVNQKSFDINKSVIESEKYSGLKSDIDFELYQLRLKSFIKDDVT